ncbi:MAG TPA: tripartite tricarboxylate transporter substrate-binding protein [Casimicrobiaceae bacterium]|nr:tripartite tricarboxylate transporter substrate-binding protein [Casimicrobiaceae bacterium]
MTDDRIPQRSRRWRAGAAIAALLFTCTASAVRAAEAGTYPSRPIRIVVPFAGGTWVDSVARIVADKLAADVRQPVVVDDRPGASGSIAADFVAKAPADGYTLLVGGVFLTTLVAIDAPHAVDPLGAFVPITRWTNAPILIVANPSLGVATLGDLFALAHRQPGRVAYATSGVGTTPHLVAVMLTQRAGVDMLHVPYVNTNTEAKDVLAGEVPVMFTFTGTVDSLVRSGRLKALAVTTRERSAVWPEVPTVAEQGFPGFDVATWSGALAPIGTPPAVVAALHREFARILQEPDVREKIAALGLQVDGADPARFAADMKSDLPRWKAVARSAGLRND